MAQLSPIKHVDRGDESPEHNELQQQESQRDRIVAPPPTFVIKKITRQTRAQGVRSWASAAVLVWQAGTHWRIHCSEEVDGIQEELGTRAASAAGDINPRADNFRSRDCVRRSV